MDEITQNTQNGTAHEGTAAPQGEVASLIELSDEEIVDWLSTSILDEFRSEDLRSPDVADGAAGPNTVPGGFWDQVTQLEAELIDSGVPREQALDQAIAIFAVSTSLHGDGTLDSTGSDFPPPPIEMLASRPTEVPIGERELIQLHSVLERRAQQAVAAWSTLQGSALRAAGTHKG